MKAKKGIIITGILLAAITIASFSVWMIPQNIPTRFVVTNAQDNLDALMEKQSIIVNGTIEGFDNLLNEQITPDEYITLAEISHLQVNSFIIEIVSSEVPPEWRNSYGAFLEHLRAYNSHLAETIVVANKLKNDPQANVAAEITRANQYLAQSYQYLADSDDERP